MWRIYYDDGRVFTSEDGQWNEAPSDGVLFVLQKVGDRVVTSSGSDHYFMTEGDVVCAEDIGPYLRKLGFVKFGRWTSIKKYEEVMRRVAADAKKWQQ